MGFFSAYNAVIFKRPKSSPVAHPGSQIQRQKSHPVHQHAEYICSNKASALFEHILNTSATSTSDVGGMKEQSNNSAKISWMKTRQKQCLHIILTLYTKSLILPLLLSMTSPCGNPPFSFKIGI